MEIVVSEVIQEHKFVQFRFPKSKKKRIRKKWSKKSENWKLCYDKNQKGYIFGGKLIVGPETFKRINNVIKSNG